MLNGALGTLAALWLYNHFVGWLTFLPPPSRPSAGRIIADYLSRRRRYRQHPCADIQAINWAAILAGRLRHRRRPLAAGDSAGQRGARRRHRLPVAQSPPSRSPNKPEEVLHAD